MTRIFSIKLNMNSGVFIIVFVKLLSNEYFYFNLIKWWHFMNICVYNYWWNLKLSIIFVKKNNFRGFNG